MLAPLFRRSLAAVLRRSWGFKPSSPARREVAQPILPGQLEGNAAGLQVGQGFRILQVAAGFLHVPVPDLEPLRVL